MAGVLGKPDDVAADHKPDDLTPFDRDLVRMDPCEYCHVHCPDGTHPHHIWARDAGGGGRLDVRINLAALCPSCHQCHHSGGRPRRDELLDLVAAREGATVREIEQAIFELRQRAKL